MHELSLSISVYYCQPKFDIAVERGAVVIDGELAGLDMPPSIK